MTSSYELVAPPASSMVEAMRSIGYSLKTAIADLLDNSITARCQNIWLNFYWNGSESYISILDDGTGMSESELCQAMLPGSKNPIDSRAEHDLGRFGLGLKTASFSQCRHLIVATKKDGVTSIRHWDLDHISETNEWRLFTDMPVGIETSLKLLDELERGTLVIWKKMDRIVGGTQTQNQRSHDAFLRKITQVQSHLGMVFHRFLDGSGKKIQFFINGLKVNPWDPFLLEEDSNATPIERFPATNGQLISVRGFVLPHWDRLADKQLAGGPNGWNAQQGFYLYRGKRLLVAGGWLGLGDPKRWPLEDQFKLARIQLDLENSMDQEWQIDVKKSIARVPDKYRRALTDLATRIRYEARKVFVYRGNYSNRSQLDEIVPIWKTHNTKHGARYTVNRKHPAVQDLMRDNKVQIEFLLKLIEMSVPIERIWLDTTEAASEEEHVIEKVDDNTILQVLEPIFQHMRKTGTHSLEEIKAKLLTMEPFGHYPHLIESLN